MKTPALIVCYLRPINLDKILSEVTKSPRKTYIFLDKAPTYLTHISDEIMKVAAKYQEKLEIITFHSESNLGVGVSVPYAVNSVLKSEESVIVLEDDCIPNQFALEYFDYFANRLNETVVMVSGRTSKSLDAYNEKFPWATLTSYPLINGWLVNRIGWSKINPLVYDFEVKKIVSWLLRNPTRILPFCFFWAAKIRVKNGTLKAWDSVVAFKMLIGNLKSINPDRTSVTVLGVDNVASNTKISNTTTSDLYLKADVNPPSRDLNESHQALLSANKEIETGIYQIGLRNLLSPLLGFLRISNSLWKS